LAVPLIMMRKLMFHGVFILFALILIIEFYIRVFGSYCEPYFDKESMIVKRRKNKAGVYKTEFTNTGYFRINNEGWNSHRDYFKRQEPGEREQETDKIRIAIVGHSNIEGLRVQVDRTLSKVLEDDLNNSGISAEVYTFGYGGMHLAQAMHISRYVVEAFQPDMLIIGTLLDDFWIKSTNKKNFLSLSVNNEKEILEIIPNRYIHEEDSPFSFLYFSKLLQYVDKRMGIGKKIYCFLNKPTSLNHKLNEKGSVEPDLNKIGLKYILNEFNKISKMKSVGKVPIFFINFSLILPSYNYEFKNIQLPFKQKVRSQLMAVIQDHPFYVIDLEEAFIDNYDKNSQKFDFKNDYHYNELAHKVIGLKLSDYVQLYSQQNLDEI